MEQPEKRKKKAKGKEASADSDDHLVLSSLVSKSQKIKDGPNTTSSLGHAASESVASQVMKDVGVRNTNDQATSFLTPQTLDTAVRIHTLEIPFTISYVQFPHDLKYRINLHWPRRTIMKRMMAKAKVIMSQITLPRRVSILNHLWIFRLRRCKVKKKPHRRTHHGLILM